MEPLGDEPQLDRGLKSRGELGIWQSLVSVFGRISTGDFADVVHVVEDDAAFSEGIVAAIAEVSRLMLSASALGGADIIFLDYFLDRDLFAHVISRRAGLAPGSLELLPAKNAYLACCGSFLVKRSSAAYLSTLLARILESADVVMPVDIALRSLLRLGAISGFVVIPPLGAPSWEQDDSSTIQTHADSSVRLAQRSHLLLRHLAAGLKSPLWCAQRLEAMHGVECTLKPASGVEEFLLYFDSLRAKMPAF